MLVSGVVLALYFWAFITGVDSVSTSLIVSMEAAVMACASLFISFVLYLWMPTKRMMIASYVSMFLLVALAATLIIGTGMTNSPFIALWMLVSVFVGIFGIYGLAPMVFLLVVFTGISAVDDILNADVVITLAVGGVLPLIISYLIWHTGRSNDSSDKAYKDLAVEFSQISDKAEIVINGIADGVVAINGQGVIELFNPAAQNITGWKKSDAISLNYKSVFKLVDSKGTELTEATDPIQQVLANNKPVHSNLFTLITHSGKNIMTSFTISPVGQVGSGVIIVFRDITSEKTEERQQAEFISTASHEMRTPVASIEGYLGLALNPSTAQIDEKARDFITKAHESAQHLGRLFQDLLDVSKTEDGRISNNPKVTDVVEFIYDVVEGLRPKATEKGLRLTYKPQPDDKNASRSERTISPIYYVNVDNDHLREVVANLVENGIKYTPSGDVIVDIKGDSDNVIISITDSGIGIPREDQAHLFQKFYRVDNTDTREIGGTGLGLYLCRRLTEAMNGRIWVESEYKKGSTFFVSLPRIANDEATRLIERSAEEEEKPLPEVGTARTGSSTAPLELSPIPEPKQPPKAASLTTPNKAATVQPLATGTPEQPLAGPAPEVPIHQPPVAPAVARVNTPIMTIEQNKSAYTERASPQILPREQK